MPPEFDENRNTILFSSGSTLFKKMAEGAAKLSKSRLDVNILVVGAPLKDEYLEIIDEENIINWDILTGSRTSISWLILRW